MLVPASSRGNVHKRSKGFLLYASFLCACMDHLAYFMNSDGDRTEQVWCKMQLMVEESGQTNVSGFVFWKEIDKRMTVFQMTVLRKCAFEEEIPSTYLLESKIQSSCKKLVESFKKSGLDTKDKALLTFTLDESKILLGEYGNTIHFKVGHCSKSFLNSYSKLHWKV